MIKQLYTSLILIFFWIGLIAQTNDPIWDVGTKWTYEFHPSQNTTTFVVNEIIDTFTISNKKLYTVESTPTYTGIQYFYYKDGKVYNYDISNDLLKLLYNFNTTTNYYTNYRPICDEFFPYDSLMYRQYTILMDSIVDFDMPDGSINNLQYVSMKDTVVDGQSNFVIDETGRTILENIGFLQGRNVYSHDWAFGMYICDEEGWVGQLRCFENDSISHNFVGYPCDSTWLLSHIEPNVQNENIRLYPNPTSEIINIDGSNLELEYEIYSPTGHFLSKGISKNNMIRLKEDGLNIIKLKINNTWVIKRIIKSD